VFINKLTTFRYQYDYKKKRNVIVLDRVYAIVDTSNLTYRFHINTLKNFMLVLGANHYTRDDIELVKNDLHYIKPLKLKFNKEYKPRPHQVEYSNALLLDNGQVFKLVDLIMGGGKGVIAMSTIVKINQAVFIMVLPKFLDKWYDEVQELTNIKEDDINLIKGSASLINTMQLAMSGKDTTKIHIASLRTISNYLKAYENKDSDFMYPVIPQDLLSTLSVGVVLNDETHLEFYAVFKTALYFNADRFIGLSATLENKDKNIRRMYQTMFPADARISGLLEHKPYVDVHAVRYRMNMNKHIKYRRAQGYNHILLEQSIMYNSVLLREYLNLIEHYVKEGYIAKRVKGDKGLIFVSSIKLATLLTNFLKRKYPKIDVRRYVEDDPYENLHEADLTISTNLAASVGHDIKQLIFVLQTVSISSIQTNLQSYGRLRKLENKETHFYYIYCKDIDNQVRMHMERKNVILPLADNYFETEYDHTLKSR